MKPWIVAMYGVMGDNQVFRAREGMTGRVQVIRHQEGVHGTGDINYRNLVFFCDDEPTCDELVNYLISDNPSATYVKAKSVAAVYREMGPRLFGKFTEKGLLPS